MRNIAQELSFKLRNTGLVMRGGLWSNEEDAYNPMNFMPMVQEYIGRCHKLGTISDDARTFAKNMNWELT